MFLLFATVHKAYMQISAFLVVIVFLILIIQPLREGKDNLKKNSEAWKQMHRP